MPAELGEYIERDVALLQQLGWTEFIRQRRGRGDLAHLHNVHHPARRLLKLYKHIGAPVKFNTKPWSRQHINQVIKRHQKQLYMYCEVILDGYAYVFYTDQK